MKELLNKEQPPWAKVKRSQLKAYQQGSRDSDWEKLKLQLVQMEKDSSTQKGTKNKSIGNHIEHMEPSHEELVNSGIPDNNLGGTFSKSKKEKAYHLSNSSQINMQPSYHSSELPEKDEFREFPLSKGGRDMAIEMRKSNILHVISLKYLLIYYLQTSYQQERQLKEGFDTYKEKEEVVHNQKNVQVQSMRQKVIEGELETVE